MSASTDWASPAEQAFVAGAFVAANKYDLAKVLRRLLDMGCKDGAHIPSTDLHSLLEWLASWGTGDIPNWYDASGRYVPLDKAWHQMLVAAYGDW